MESLIPTTLGSATLIHFLLEIFLIFSSRERDENLFKIRLQPCSRWICLAGNGWSSSTVRRGTNERCQGYCTGNQHDLWPVLYLTYSVPACKALWKLGKRSKYWSWSSIAAAQRRQVGRVSCFLIHIMKMVTYYDCKYHTKAGGPRMGRGPCRYLYARFFGKPQTCGSTPTFDWEK